MKVLTTGYKKEFVTLDSFSAALSLVLIVSVTFFLTFATVPIGRLTLHFFQAGIFLAGFLFGPFAGAAVGAVVSSYTGLFVINNPWIIFGNVILGFFAAHFYFRMHPIKAVLLAYIIQLPYLLITDIFLVGMPMSLVAKIAVLLVFGNVISSAVAGIIAPSLRMFFVKTKDEE